MEKQLFDWESWDQSDTMLFLYYNVTLKYKAAVDYENGVLELYPDETETHDTFSLELKVL
jgi:hypothetical protein